MRIPLPTDIKTRTGAPSDKDARQKNSYVETKGEEAIVRKRPSAQGGIATGTGVAQGGIGLNINGTPYFIGFWADTMQSYTGGGTSWGSATSYSTGDHVSVNFEDYWALADNTNSQPPSANWSKNFVPAVGVAITYATWNASDHSGGVLLSNGDLTATINDNGLSSASNVRATISKSSGKWYWEVLVSSIGISTLRASTGVANATENLYGVLGSTVNSWGHEPSFSGDICNALNSIAVINNVYSCFGSNYASASILGYALDMGAGTLTMYINGVSQGVIFTGLTGSIFPAIGNRGNGATTITMTANFGATAFTYTVPSGYNSGLYV